MISKIHNPGLEPLYRFLDGEIPHPHIMTADYVPTIGLEHFPVQDTEKIGTVLNVKYYDSDNHFETSGVFEIIRWDAELPYVVIMVNRERGKFIVSSIKNLEEDGDISFDEYGKVLQNGFIHYIPFSLDGFVGIPCYMEFFDSVEQSKGVILRADAANAHPIAVICDDITKRIYLSDEVRVLIKIEDIDHGRPVIDIIKEYGI